MDDGLADILVKAPELSTNFFPLGLTTFLYACERGILVAVHMHSFLLYSCTILTSIFCHLGHFLSTYYLHIQSIPVGYNFNTYTILTSIF